MSRRTTAVAAALAALGLWLAGQGAWIHVKARLAQVLLERAWARGLVDGRPPRPWPWADTRPWGRLHLPGGRVLLVLQGDSGRTLAFGPGHAPGSGAPGSGRTVLISGHRDTHFAVLQKLRPGQVLYLETPRAGRSYRITKTAVVDARHRWLADTPGERLVLSTCYPFDAVLPGGPLRYLVLAQPWPSGSDRIGSDRPNGNRKQAISLYKDAAVGPF
jgi:sortase A